MAQKKPHYRTTTAEFVHRKTLVHPWRFHQLYSSRWRTAYERLSTKSKPRQNTIRGYSSRHLHSNKLRKTHSIRHAWTTQQHQHPVITLLYTRCVYWRPAWRMAALQTIHGRIFQIHVRLSFPNRNQTNMGWCDRTELVDTEPTNS